MPSPDDDPLLGQLLAGTYRLEARLGQGGMGVVYQAQDERLNRRVALKLLTGAGPLDASSRERFAREAKLLASLGHPNVVRLFDVGETEGTPFFAMQLLPGPSLDRWIAEQAPDEKTWRAALDVPPAELRGRVRWIVDAARAVDEAHEAGAVHRDLKPANLMLDERGRINVLDFGVAHVIGSERTATHARLGTPRFMAPEQLLDPKGVDRRADVYALGLTLYAVLSLGKPFPDLEDDHAILLRVGRGDVLPLGRRNPKVPADLATIVGKAIELRPQDRYPTAAALADDLERWLEDRPITARPAGALERLGKFARREPGKARALAILILATVGSLGLALHARTQALAALRARAETKQALALALEQAKRANAEAASARRAEARAVESATRAERDRERALAANQHARENMRTALQVLGERAAAEGDGQHAAALLAAALPEPGDPALQGALVRVLGRVWSAEELVVSGAPVWAFDRGKDRVACAASDGVGLYDPSGQRLVFMKHEAPVHAVALEPKSSFAGPRIASAPWDHTVLIHSRTGELLHTLRGHTGLVKALAWSPDGAWLASGGDRTVRLWGVDGGEVRAEHVLECDGLVEALAFQRGGMLAIAAGRQVTIWELARGRIDDLSRRRRLEGHAARVRALTWSPSGERLVSGGDDGQLILWDLSGVSPEESPRGLLPGRSPPRGHEGAVTHLAWGVSRFASGSVDGTVRVWSEPNAEPLETLSPGVGPVQGLAWGADGRLFSMHAGELRVWSAGRALTYLRPSGSEPLQALACVDGKLWAGGHDGRVTLWAQPEPAWVDLPAHSAAVWHLAWAAEGRRVVSATLGGEVRLSGVTPGEHQLGFETGAPLAAVHPSPSGDHVIVVSKAGAASLWDPRAPKSLRELGSATAVAWARDGHGFAIAAGRDVRVWGAPDTTARVARAPGVVSALCWGNDGELYGGGDGGLWVWPAGADPRVLSQEAVRRLAVGAPGRLAVASDRRVELWRAGGRAGPDLELERAQHLAWSGDDRLAVAGVGGARIFDAQGRDERWPFTDRPASWVGWSGERLALTSAGAVELWDQRRLRLVLREALPGELRLCAWSPDGAWLATTGETGSVRLWRTATLFESPEALGKHVTRLTKLRVEGLRVVAEER